MTKKDYIKIAKIVSIRTLLVTIKLRKKFGGSEQEVLFKDDLVNDFVIMFKKDNDRFDKDKFIKACQ